MKSLSNFEVRFWLNNKDHFKQHFDSKIFVYNFVYLSHRYSCRSILSFSFLILKSNAEEFIN